ncbi:MAG: flagellar basal body-associated FliL family protein [Brevinema sp.]
MPTDEEMLDDDLESSQTIKSTSPIAQFLSKALGYLISVIVSIIFSVSIMFLVFNGKINKERNEDVITVQLQPKPAPLSYFDVGEFRLNTADIDANHFIRISLSLGYKTENKLLHNELVSRTIQIKDLILNLLNTKEKNQLDEYLEKEQLKEEIRRTINNIMINGEVEAIYYTEFQIS